MHDSVTLLQRVLPPLGPPESRFRAIYVAAAMVMMVTAGCVSAEPVGGSEPTPSRLAPHDRAVRIETTGCGFAPERTGSGVAVGDGLVLTVAHLVARANGISVSVGDGGNVNAVVAAIDLNRDLALLRLPSNGISAIDMSSVGAGADGFVVGGAASGTVPFEVKGVVSLSIQEILGTERHSRLGYELQAVTATGDSGAGAYDDENRLIGIVFATGPEGTAWATAASEIEPFLAAPAREFSCDPAGSRIR